MIYKLLMVARDYSSSGMAMTSQIIELETDEEVRCCFNEFKGNSVISIFAINFTFDP